MENNDMKYGLDLFSRMEKAQVNGKPLSSYTLHGDTPLWHRFSQFLYDGDIKRFAKTRSFEKYEKESRSFAKTRFVSLLLSLFAFLITCLSALFLIFGKIKVLVFSVDNANDKKEKADFRLCSLYKILRKKRVSFVECFHTQIGKSFILNLFSRKRFALYLEGIDGIWYIYRLFAQKKSFSVEGLSGTEDEIRFMKQTVRKYIAIKDMLVFRKWVLTFILRYSNIKLILGIDDVRHYHELLEAASECGIHTTLFQHGHFTEYHVGWLARDIYKGARYTTADEILVWSTYWKEELLRLGSVYGEDDIAVSGYPSNKVHVSFKEKKEGVTVLIPHETIAPKDEVFSYIKAFANCDDVHVFFKVRPDQSIGKQLSVYPGDVREFSTVVTSLEEVPKPDFVAGVYSTFLYDVALAGVSILRMETSMDYGKGMVENDMADSISLGSLCDKLFVDENKRNARSLRLASEASFEDAVVGRLAQFGVV